MDTAKDQDFRKLEKKLRKATATAAEDFSMISPGDKIMVCLSGGKDSYTLLDMLLYLKKVVPFEFEIVAVNLDQKQPDFPEHILPDYLKSLAVPFRILEYDTYSIVKEKIPEGKTMCSLCSRLRRGILYSAATEMGCTKIALGHHREDILETFFLNLFFASKLETMSPKYKANDYEHIIIRPLAYCKEKDIEQYAVLKEYPIIPCNLCGTQENLQRQVIKNMILEWEKEYPNRPEIMFKAISNIAPSHMLDRNLFDFENLKSMIPEVNLEEDM